jgi:tRNA pseudouridine38-40 synthase
VPRWALGVEYDGACFAGFQRQPHHDRPTVQGELEGALSRIADDPVRTVCAGRTDAGVHATAQVVHFDTDARRTADAWVRGGNTLTAPGVGIAWAAPVPDDFHARFSARWRSYLYLLADGSTVQPLLRDRVAAHPVPLDASRMQAAADMLLGERDFTSFRAAGCQARHAVREIQHVHVYRRGPLLGFEIRANAFLQHMVRNIVGSLALVGAGERSVAWIGELLEARDRTLAGATALPGGLYLVGVGYPDHPELPAPDATVVLPWRLVVDR